MNVIAVGAALASATGFAVATSLQHHAAGSAPDDARGLLPFVRHLLSTPTWLLGQALALMSFALHAVALHAGPLALVQPIVVSGVVIAVPVRSAMGRRAPRAREMSAVAAATAGLAVFIVASSPTEGHDVVPGWDSLLLTLGGAAVAATAIWLSTRVGDRRAAATMLGFAAGILFGLVAGMVKLTLDAAVDDGVVGAMTAWPLWLLLLCGAAGITSNQRAYTLASLSASLPVLNVLSVMVGLCFGLVVFSEVPRHDPLAIVLQLGALALAGVGLKLIATVEDEVEAPVPAAAGAR